MATGPNTTSGQDTSKAGDSALPPPYPRETDVLALYSDILASFKTEISAVIKLEMKATLSEDLAFIKGELQAVRAELANNVRSE